MFLNIILMSNNASFLGCLMSFHEQLQWATNYESRGEILQILKEIGSLIFFMNLLDTAVVWKTNG